MIGNLQLKIQQLIGILRPKITSDDGCTELLLHKHVTVDRKKPLDTTDITHDTNSKLEFPTLEIDVDVERPPDSSGDERNPITTLNPIED